MKVMCFAMREGIVDQRSDVCGDAETNVNERRTTTAFPPTPCRTSVSPPPQGANLSLCIPSTNHTTDFSSIFLSFSFNIRVSLSSLEPRDSYTLI